MHVKDFNVDDSVLHSTWIDKLHKQFIAFYEQIDRSKAKILNLHENWDDEGAKGYKKETWEQAAAFIKKLFVHLWRQSQKLIKSPNILPGPDGSIDIHWKTTKFDLLINVPEDPAEPATFSCDDYGQNMIKGLIDLEKINQVLISWLVEFI